MALENFEATVFEYIFSLDTKSPQYTFADLIKRDVRCNPPISISRGLNLDLCLLYYAHFVRLIRSPSPHLTPHVATPRAGDTGNTYLIV
ncbi:hypothetical protein BELL_0421g00120 [Botrytis elliptica]|uniref:Uncharacterized protein n=1 Tax=Botrytis elliptica TaxID=278938 RepID=A0A4Z1JHE0_9HELO|nr:hypothetical protein BELL_0421g00120 [Botrytis elliptica]